MSRYAFNLKPCGPSQKSFYGKSIVIVTNDRHENTQRLVIRYAMKEWKCKSFKAFCDASPKISTDGTYIIKAMCKPTVSLTNIQ